MQREETAPTAVHAIVVHYRSAGMVAGCVADLLAQRGVTVSVTAVECGPDGSLDALPPTVRVLTPGRNLGYAGGNALGLASLPEDDVPVLLVNPDVRVPSTGTVRMLVDALALEPTLAAVAPSLLRQDGRRESTGSTWDPGTAQALHTGARADRWPHVEVHVDLPWLNGACLLLRRQAVRAIGPLDQRFFLYYEEVEWCLRAVTAGWRLRLLAECVHHAGSASFSGSQKGAYYAVRNRHLLGRLHGRGPAWRARWVRETFRLLRRRPDQRGAALRGLRDALLHRYGAMPGDEAVVPPGRNS